MDELTKEDIKNSVEYKWRIQQRNTLLIIYILVLLAAFFMMAIAGLTNASEFEDNMASILTDAFLIVAVLFTVIFMPFIAFYQYKAVYLLKKYHTFKRYEVLLDRPSTSYWYRGAVYYTVDISTEKGNLSVDTNPYFSSSVWSAFNISEFNNKKVIGLLDEEKGGFYIIKAL